MAFEVSKISLMLTAAVALLSLGATAQSGSSINSCTNTVVSLSPCLNYVSGNTSRPSSSCCSALANVVQTNPQCLCSLLNNGGGSTLGVVINQTVALALPRACNVQTPPISQCNGAAAGPSPSTAPLGTIPSAAPSTDSPTSSPGDPATEAPSPDVPTETGSSTLPTTQGSFSDGSIVKSSLHLVAFVVSITAVLA